MWEFYRQCLKRAATSGWDAANAVSLAIGVLGGIVAWRLPQYGGDVEALLWLIPLGAFTAWFVFRAARAPFELWQEGHRAVSESQKDAATADAELREHRNCQAIADYLTKEHEYGVHQLLHRPPTTLDELPQWNRWVQNWNEAIFVEMERLSCTAQELNHVRTISILDVTVGMPRLPEMHDWPMSEAKDVMGRVRQRMARSAVEAQQELEIPVRMHAIRLSRVADVSTSYANRAEVIRMAATTRAPSNRL